MTKKIKKDTPIEFAAHKDYSGLLAGVSELLEQARHAAAIIVQQPLTLTLSLQGRGNTWDD